MKSLITSEMDEVSRALNFTASLMHTTGGCEIYTTKCAGDDKKLYKYVEGSLEAQYQYLVRFSESLSPRARSPTNDEMDLTQEQKYMNTIIDAAVNLPQRDSPFGSLNEASSRLAFAHLIAALNASHPDYEFRSALKPSDFKREKSLFAMTQRIDNDLSNMRGNDAADPSRSLMTGTPSLYNRFGNEVWCARMWTMIDNEMSLEDCELYSWAPKDDPFEDNDGSLWSMHYFFYNKQAKRVCYLHTRSVSVLPHIPMPIPVKGRRRVTKYRYDIDDDVLEDDDDDDDDAMVIGDTGDEDDSNPYVDMVEFRARLDSGYGSHGGLYGTNVDYSEYADDDSDDVMMLLKPHEIPAPAKPSPTKPRRKQGRVHFATVKANQAKAAAAAASEPARHIRGVSEDAVEDMEL